MTDEPRFLGTSDAAERPPSSPPARASEVQPTPEQRAVIEAVMAGRIDEVAPRTCIGCESRECSPVYVLLDHGSIEVGRRFSIVGTISIQQSTLSPCVLPMCARCYGRVAANRRRHQIGAVMGALGILTGLGYFAAALAKASTATALTLLFVGGALMALAMIHAVFNLRALHAQLKLPKLPGMSVLVVSKNREDLERSLERCKLNSLELQNQIERKAMEASSLPTAKINAK